MVLVVAVALAAITGAAVWHEARNFTQRNGQYFRGIEPRFAAAGAALLTFIVGFVASPIVLGALVGFATFREATMFEDQQREQPLGVEARMWAGVGFVFGLFGALFTSTLLWSVVCAFFLMAGALFFATSKIATLRAHRDRLLTDNSALIAEREKLREAAAQPQKRSLESYERRRTAAAAVSQSTWTAPATGGDLLPRSR